jgi:hypothetical protein
MWGAMNNIVYPEVLDVIRGKSFLAVQAAAQELARRNLDIVGYRIQVIMTEPNSVIVTFIDQNQPDTVLGSIGKPGFEVELDSRDLSVRRSNFVK